jgi:hypothetical protein
MWRSLPPEPSRLLYTGAGGGWLLLCSSCGGVGAAVLDCATSSAAAVGTAVLLFVVLSPADESSGAGASPSDANEMAGPGFSRTGVGIGIRPEASAAADRS